MNARGAFRIVVVWNGRAPPQSKRMARFRFARGKNDFGLAPKRK
jgi:G:T/U-mismatch repair DNA glycosylase